MGRRFSDEFECVLESFGVCKNSLGAGVDWVLHCCKLGETLCHRFSRDDLTIVYITNSHVFSPHELAEAQLSPRSDSYSILHFESQGVRNKNITMLIYYNNKESLEHLLMTMMYVESLYIRLSNLSSKGLFIIIFLTVYFFSVNDILMRSQRTRVLCKLSHLRDTRTLITFEV